MTARYLRIVIKIGSALLTAGGTRLASGYISRISSQIAAAHAQGCEIALVSSGAVAAGIRRLGWRARPARREDLQVAAAVGQMGLINAYEETFAQHQLHAAQVLLTAEDMAHRTLYLNARLTLRQMLSHAIIPVINENDVIATDQVSFGDNDKLAAQVSNLLEADLLVMLTDTGGLYRQPGQPQSIIRTAAASDKTLAQYVAETTDGDANRIGSGGMASKLAAAATAARSGCDSLIVDGRADEVIARAIRRDEELGTWLTADLPRLSARKQWLASGLHVRGAAVLDGGAVRAVGAQQRSLLPAGVLRVSGQFIRGDAISLTDDAGALIGYALVNYDSAAAAKICGQKSDAIAGILGYQYEEELAHRDNISVLV